jgi:anaerobic magnesium-protoporphyrin IX monomethyl ester cyclase
MKRLSFLLLNPPMDYTRIRKEFSMEAYLPPLGLLYLATPLERQGHAVSVVDFIAEPYSEERLRPLLSNADVVGISITSQVASSAAMLVDFIKRTAPHVTVVIGGPHVTLQRETTLSEMKADVAVVGEGEATIEDLADALGGGRPLSQVHGVFYREGATVKEGLPAKEIENLDSIPFPSRNYIAQYTYGKREIAGVTFFAKGKITSMVTTRGCPFRCRFCVSKAILKRYRTRSAANVVAELEEIAKDYDSVFIVDDNFLSDKKRAGAIMDLLIERRLPLEIWISGVRVTDADEGLFRKMKQAGVKSLEFGIESGNEDVLKYYNKKITLDDVRKAVRMSKRLGFLTIGNFIIGAPIETPQTVDDTIRFAQEINLDFAFFYPFYFMKGSEIWDDARAAGKIREDELFPSPDSRRGLGNFTPEEFTTMVSSAYRRFYFTPRYIASQLIRQVLVYHNFRVFKAGLKVFLQQPDANIFDIKAR